MCYNIVGNFVNTSVICTDIYYVTHNVQMQTDLQSYYKEEWNMSVSTSSVMNTVAEVYTATNPAQVKESASNKKEDVKDKNKKNENEGVVYEKSEGTEKKPTYSINKMSSEERAALVKQLKADQESRQQSLINIVKDMMSKQATTFAQANGNSDDIWKFLASGDYTVDAETKAKAQADIAEDGYYGVKQTSQRMFDFACALAGDDVEKMKEMQKAMEKGFKQATKAWGKELPEICQNTLDAANKMFEEYYASKNVEE